MTRLNWKRSLSEEAAGSGVGVSVLLRQPHGFEGVLPLLVHDKAFDRSVADRPHLLDADRRLYPIATTVIDGAENDHVLTGIDELVGFHRTDSKVAVKSSTKRRA